MAEQKAPKLNEDRWRWRARDLILKKAAQRREDGSLSAAPPKDPAPPLGRRTRD